MFSHHFSIFFIVDRDLNASLQQISQLLFLISFLIAVDRCLKINIHTICALIVFDETNKLFTALHCLEVLHVLLVNSLTAFKEGVFLAFILFSEHHFVKFDHEHFDYVFRYHSA